MSQLSSTDVAVSILIKYLERLLNLFFTVSVPHLSCHHRKKLGKIDGSISVGVHFVDHVLKLSFGGILTQWSHDSSKLFCGDGTITVWHAFKSHYGDRSKKTNADLYRKERKLLWTLKVMNVVSKRLRRLRLTTHQIFALPGCMIRLSIFFLGDQSWLVTFRLRDWVRTCSSYNNNGLTSWSAMIGRKRRCCDKRQWFVAWTPKNPTRQA